jgi:hypothetical protein
MSIYNPGTKVPNYSPLWDTTQLEPPRDRATINAWVRSLYALDPDVYRLINQHALLISSAYELIDSKSHNANQFCAQQLEKLNIQSLLEQIIIEYFVIGEVFVYLELNEKEGRWDRALIQNPDYIIVKRSVVDSAENTSYFLRPDENLRRICFSNRPEDIVVRNLLTTSIVEPIRKGENIPLDSFYLFHLAHRISPYEIRGSSFSLPLFELLKKPNFPTMSIEERRAIKQTLFDITSFDKKSIAKDVLFQRYSVLINSLEFWLNQKLLTPIAKINNFYTEVDGEKIPIYPQVKFNMTKLKRAINKIK